MAITLQRWPIVDRRSELEIFEQALGSGERTGHVIHGRAGVGKTRLADECAAQAAASGYPTAVLFEQTRRALLDRHEERRLVTVADDVSLLDDVSLALLGYLAGQQLQPVMAARFYEELFGRHPDLRALFTTDMAEQEVKFAEKLTLIVGATPRLAELLSHTQTLGARDVGYGVRAADYQSVGEALLAALAAVLGDVFDAAAPPTGS